MEMGWKKWFINISDDEKWLIFMIENSLKIMRNGWWKIIYKYDWILKMTYENKWEWKANYKYKWDNFFDYDMKNHDIHENKNVCPEFNGEKMHEHICRVQMQLNPHCVRNKSAAQMKSE